MARSDDPSRAINAVDMYGVANLAAAKIQPISAFESTTAIYESIFPPSLRHMLDMQRDIERLADPLGLTKLARSMHMGGRSNLGSLDASYAATAQHNKLLNTSTLRDLTRGLEAATSYSKLLRSVAPFTNFDRMLAPVLGASAKSRWQHAFARSILPSLSVLGAERHRPLGVLSTFAKPGFGAALGWRPMDETTPRAAALLAEGSARSQIVIDVHVTCALCGDDMIQHERRFQWRGNRKGLLDVSIVPMCAECMRRANEDATYFENALNDIQAPTLRVVATGGTTDGTPRGKLRLVREHRDDDDAVE